MWSFLEFVNFSHKMDMQNSKIPQGQLAIFVTMRPFLKKIASRARDLNADPADEHRLH